MSCTFPGRLETIEPSFLGDVTMATDILLRVLDPAGSMYGASIVVLSEQPAEISVRVPDWSAEFRGV